MAARYAFMKRWRRDYPVALMARVLNVSRSGFYAWLERPPSARARQDDRLKVAIAAAHRKTRETYGAVRLQAELCAEGWVAGRDRIARLRRELGIRCRQKRPFKATTDSTHTLPVAENLLDQTFTAQAAGEVWHADITAIPTGEGWLYLAGVKDQFTRAMVGYAVGARMSQDLTLTALSRAIRSQRPAPGVIHHSDRGSQYCALAYQHQLRRQGFRVSMSRTGNCYDNAPMESLWGSLKSELTHHHRYDTRAEAEAAIREYIEIFYNRQRRHSRLGNVAPAVFALNGRQQQRAA
jgi:transposase InsO family protein